MKIELFKYDKEPSCFGKRDVFEEEYYFICRRCPFSAACWLEYCEKEEQYRYEHNIP